MIAVRHLVACDWACCWQIRGGTDPDKVAAEASASGWALSVPAGTIPRELLKRAADTETVQLCAAHAADATALAIRKKEIDAA